MQLQECVAKLDLELYALVTENASLKEELAAYHSRVPHKIGYLMGIQIFRFRVSLMAQLWSL